MRGGPFPDMTEFLTRVYHKDLNKKSLESLIKAGVFDSLGVDRSALLSHLDEILAFSQNIKKSHSKENGGRDSGQSSLFGGSASAFSTPAFLQKGDEANTTSPEGNNQRERLTWEKELLGLYLSGHPLDPYAEKIKNGSIKSIKELLNSKTAMSCKIAGIVSKIKRIISKTGQPILFAEIEDLSDRLEAVVFADAINKNPTVWKENNAILLAGRLSHRNGEPKFICEQAVELQ